MPFGIVKYIANMKKNDEQTLIMKIREVRGAAPHLALEEVLLRSREEQGGAEEIDEKLSKTKTNSETHFQDNNIMNEFSLIIATSFFWF